MLKGDNVEDTKEKGNEHLDELFNFSVVVRRKVKDIEKIKEHIIRNYVNTGLVNLIKPTYDKKENLHPHQ